MDGIQERTQGQGGAHPPEQRPPRSAGIDNLKVFLTLLVVLHHAGQPYGPTGGSWPVSHAQKLPLLGPFFHINASFFMGLFFLISGYYLDAACQRKGPAAFLRERLCRFGVPIVLFGFGFVPLARHFLGGKAWADSFLPFEWAHLWFLGHLLVYSMLYATLYATLYAMLYAMPYSIAYPVLRARADRRRGAIPPAASNPWRFPGAALLLAYALGLALVSTLVRLWYPIDRWVNLGVPAELAHLPQYASLLAFGVLAARHGWLERIPVATGRAALALAFAMVALRYAASILDWNFFGGHGLWTDYAWCLWEALLCVGMCLGLLHGFQAWGAGAQVATRFLARHAFTVYVLHLPILVMVQMALEHTSLGPLTLTLVSGTVTAVTSYALAGFGAAAIRRLRAPGRRGVAAPAIRA